MKFAQLKPRTKRILWIAMALMAALIVTGCQTLGYYRQAMGGQLEILRRQRPIEALLADQQTPPPLREKLELVLALRRYAEGELRLPVDGHYLRYADLHRRFVVWNVHAAPDLSLKAKGWWYPFVGTVTYRGYFSEKAARDYGRKLEREGYDVYTGGVEAYSTLGWFTDPVLNTFIGNSPDELASIIFHELAHQRLFIGGDTEFNEAFATAVAEEGVRRWLSNADPVRVAEHRESVARKEQFIALVNRARDRLEAVYGKGAEDPVARAARRFEKEQVIGKMRDDYAALKREWGGYSGYDAWFARPINNAQLNTVATYYNLVPGFRAMIVAHAGDLDAFYAEVKRLDHLGKAERHRRMWAAGEKRATGEKK